MAATPHSQPTIESRRTRSHNESRSNRRACPESSCITDRDLELLQVVAAHRFVIAPQVREWMGTHEVAAYRRLRALLAVGALSYRRIFHARPGCYQVTAIGLALIESGLPVPVTDLRTYRHDLGVVWLWLGGLRGAFGPAEGVLSERQMRSNDQRPVRQRWPFGIPLGDCTSGGKPRVHFPDVVLAQQGGSRVALELELTLKSRRRLEAILCGYLAERRVERVLYLTDSETIATAVSDAGQTFGLDGRLEVDYLGRAPEGSIELGWDQLIAARNRRA